MYSYHNFTCNTSTTVHTPHLGNNQGTFYDCLAARRPRAATTRKRQSVLFFSGQFYQATDCFIRRLLPPLKTRFRRHRKNTSALSVVAIAEYHHRIIPVEMDQTCSPAMAFGSEASYPPQATISLSQTSLMTPEPLSPGSYYSIKEESVDGEDSKKPTKKRKSWGQELPTPKTNLPPRYTSFSPLLHFDC